MGKKSRKKKSIKSRKAPPAPAVRGAVLGLLVLALAAAALAAGIGIWKLTSGPDDGNATTRKFPSFVYDRSAPKDSPKAYQAAIDHYDDFGKIPCYCGCGRSAGHESLQFCFIKSRDGDNIKYDNHGAGWTLCVDEALYVLQGKSEGKPIEQIRAEIDEMYGGGKTGTPTPTPPV